MSLTSEKPMRLFGHQID